VIVISCGQDPPVVISLKVIAGIAAQLSVAVAIPVLAGSVLAVHSIVIFGGQVITGGWVSPPAVMI
jgi:hydrogenase maturation factor HypE